MVGRQRWLVQLGAFLFAVVAAAFLLHGSSVTMPPAIMAILIAVFVFVAFVPTLASVVVHLIFPTLEVRGDELLVLTGFWRRRIRRENILGVSVEPRSARRREPHLEITVDCPAWLPRRARVPRSRIDVELLDVLSTLAAAGYPISR